MKGPYWYCLQAQGPQVSMQRRRLTYLLELSVHRCQLIDCIMSDQRFLKKLPHSLCNWYRFRSDWYRFRPVGRIKWGRGGEGLRSARILNGETPNGSRHLSCHTSFKSLLNRSGLVTQNKNAGVLMQPEWPLEGIDSATMFETIRSRYTASKDASF